MKAVGKALVTGAVLLAAAVGRGAAAEAPPIRIGATYSKTGSLAAPGQNQRRGAELCVKHTNEKGGVLGRRIELLVEDDRSSGTAAAALYETLITRDKVDAVFSPYSSPVTAGMADVTERHRMSLIAAAAATSIFQQGRKYAFMMPSPAERYLEGLIDIAASRGLKTVAVLHEETLLQRSIARGAMALAKKRGLRVVLAEAYPKGTTDFASMITKVKTANPDVLAVATYDTVAITRLLKDLDVNPKMFGATVDVAFPHFYQSVGRDGEFVYGASLWEPELVTLRAGGLIPIARQYPGARELVEAHRKDYPDAEISYHTGQGYGTCQVLLEAIRRAGSLDREKIRDAVLGLDFNTAFGRFKVDRDGLQIGHRMVLFQWQDGKKVVVWPDEIAPVKPRFPTPPWSERR